MIIDGRKIAEKILEELKTQVVSSEQKLRLVAVLVGDHPGSLKFLELKEKAAKKVGIEYEIHKLSEQITLGDLQEKIRNIATMNHGSGLILELPLPSHLPVQKVLDAIPAEKDVDVLSAQSQGLYFANESKILPPAVEAVKIILEHHEIDIKSKNCVVFGYGLLVGRQVSHWLARHGATLTVINEFTVDPGSYSRNADILISAVGMAGLVNDSIVKDGAIVIDFGYENVDGKAVGDVDFESVSKKASLITPVPGGVGPIVVAAVLKNLVILSGVQDK